MPSMHLKDGGAWDQVNRGEVTLKQSGSHNEVDNIYLKDGGVWYPMFPLVAKARWGYATFAGSGLNENGHSGPQTFIDTYLTNMLSSNDDGEQFSSTLPDANTFAYFATPASLGIGTLFLDTGSQFTGGWDGATWSLDPFSDNSFLNTGPATVTYDGGYGDELWYVYRTDYAGPSSAILWELTWPNRPVV